MSAEQAQKTVLIVDDEAEAVDLLAAIIEAEGYTAIAATDGDEGVEKAKAERPDVIVLDVQMPRVDGFEAFYRLQQDDGTADIPVIMLTGVAQRTGLKFSARDMGQFIGREPAAYIEKPVQSDELLSTIRRVLE